MVTNVTNLSDVSLQAGDTIVPDDKPELESSEPLAQRHLPVHVVDGQARVFVLEVQRLHVEGFMQGAAVFHPLTK